MNKILENYYSKLKNRGLLSNYNSYPDFEKFLLDESKSGDRITKFHSLLMKSSVGPKIKRAELFWEILVTIQESENRSNKDLIEFLFYSLKSEEYLSKFETPGDLLNSLSTPKMLNNFAEFLVKNEYDPGKLYFKTIFNEYKKSFNAFSKRIEKILTTDKDPLKAISLVQSENENFIRTKLYEDLEIKVYKNYFSIYLNTKIKECRNDLNRLNELQKEAKKISSNCNASIYKSSIDRLGSEIDKLARSIDHENSVITSFDAIRSKSEKLPQSLYVDNIEESLLSTESSVYGYYHLLRIGSIKHNNIAIPVLYDFFKSGGFIVKKEGNGEKAFALMQNIVFRLLFSLPPGHIKLKLIDEDLGSSFQHLLNLPEDIKGSKVYYDESEVLKLFDEIKKRDSNIIFNKLKSSYKNIIDYNRVNEFEFEPIEIYLFNSFPEFVSEQHLKYISNQISKGSKTGSYYMLAIDPDQDIKDDKVNYFVSIYNSLPSINEIHELEYLGKTQLLDSMTFDLDNEVTLPDYAIKQFQELNKNNQYIEEITPNSSESILDSSEGIKIKIGNTDKRKPVYIDISNHSGAYHGLICGTTGSGKSVLLHKIITQSVKQYTPQELQFVLLDYKEGTGFKVYKDLPHARIIAVDADIDFGYESFKFLSEEMKERARLFKNYDTKDITQFKEKTGKDCPRILVIADEFQVLLEGKENNYDLNNKIRKAIEDIVRLGRSFGIHLLLATQTPSGVKWSSSTLENIAIRIGLRMSSDAENYLFKHNKPIASEFIDKFGKAVYNDKSGVESQSVVFNIDNLDEDKIHLVVEEAKIDAKKNNNAPEKRTVYEGDKYYMLPAPSHKNLNWNQSNESISVVLGKTADINNSIHYLVHNQDQIPSCLILGSNERVKKNLLILFTSEFIIKSSEESRMCIYFDSNMNKQWFESTIPNLPNIDLISSKVELIDYIRRMNLFFKGVLDGKVPSKRFLFCLFGIQNIGDIKNISIDDAEFGGESVSKFFKDKMLSASSISFNFLSFCDNRSEIKNTLGLTSDNFQSGITLSGFQNRVKDDLSDTIELKENQAVHYIKEKNLEIKFNAIDFDYG